MLKYVWICLSAIGAFAISLLGGWDWALQTLLVLIAADFITGLAAAFCGASAKSSGGRLESGACIQGLFRKAGILAALILAVAVDQFFGTDGFARYSVIIFFSGNEGLSLLENLGIMGVPLPLWIKDKLEILAKKSEE